MEEKKEPRKLPTLAELHFDPEQAFKNDEFNLLLNQPVPVQWIQQHPIVNIKNATGNMIPLPYITIEKIEFLLTSIFQQWRVEIIHAQQLFNAVAVTVRLHYLHPVTGEWSYQDGVGAVAVQTDKGEGAFDLSKIKADAVMKALPAAKSYATKDAAENLGILFGKNLSRKDTLAFTIGNSKYSDEDKIKSAAEQIKNARTQQ